LNDPLIWLRALHFAATASLAGALLFWTLISEPVLRTVQADGHVSGITGRRPTAIVWISFAFALATGAGWFVLQTARMTDVSPSAAFAEGAAWNVLFNTDFGNVWAARTVFAALFGATLLLDAVGLNKFRASGALLTALAVAFVGTLAFAGHAAAGSDVVGAFHLGADILHLVAAATWLGALLPLAVLLSAAASQNDGFSMKIAQTATLRFSTLGIVSVATLVVTGIVNSWVLVGSVDALVTTDYGRLLSLKVVLFIVMLSVAAFNRLRLTPRLVEGRSPVKHSALRQLRTNCLTEVGIGLVILFVVGVLGTLPPGSNERALVWRHSL